MKRSIEYALSHLKFRLDDVKTGFPCHSVGRQNLGMFGNVGGAEKCELTAKDRRSAAGQKRRELLDGMWHEREALRLLEEKRNGGDLIRTNQPNFSVCIEL